MAKIEINGIDHVKLAVRNPAATYRYYRELFGFRVYEGTEEEPEIIGNERVKLCIHRGEPGILHFGFQVTNYEDIPSMCRDHDEEPIFESHWPASDSFYLSDPDAMEIELSRVWGGGLDKRMPEDG